VLRTQQIVAAMDAYARQFPQPHCVNARAECPYWAALGQCPTNYEYMITECPLACRYCDHMVQYLRCRSVLHANSRRPHPPKKSLPASHITQWKDWILSSSGEFRARNVLERAPSTNDEWAVLLDSFVSPEERGQIRSTLLQQLEFRPSVADGYDIHDTLPLHSQSDPDVPQVVRRTSASAHCDLQCIQQNPALQSVLKRLLKLLRVPATTHTEKPVELVSYGPRDTFARHSDCRVHDSWKGGGYRAVTAYIALDGSEATVGFPHFWEMVHVKAGQLLVWPNVKNAFGSSSAEASYEPATTAAQGQSAAVVECNKNMTSEVLASPGTSRGVIVHVRLHPMDESLPAECR
jgi:ShK domain-like